MPVLKKVSSIKPEVLESICEALKKDKELLSILPALQRQAKGLLAKSEFEALKDLKVDISNGEFKVEDFQKIINFLQKLALIGNTNTVGEYSDNRYTVGSEGLAIINEFYRHKPINNDLCRHQVSVVKNTDTAEQASANKFVHSGFLKALQDDLRDVALESPFEKTYIVERNGSVGENHIITVSVRKNAGEEAPLINMFDSSPSLVRIGLRQCQENIANGTLSHFIVLATLQKAFNEKGLKVEQDKFFHNSEPFQSQGFSYCGTFALEQAYINARMSRTEHEDFLLQHFVYDSVLGGKTEMDVGPEEIERSSIEKRKVGDIKSKNFQSPIAAQSHFSSHYEDHKHDMEWISYDKKDGSTETMDDRRRRYLRVDAQGVTANELVQQKSMRHRVHLFEIIRHAALNKIFSDISAEGALEESKRFIAELESRNVPSVLSEIAETPNKAAFNLINSGFGAVDNIFYDEESDVFKISLRCGDIRLTEISKKVEDWNKKGQEVAIDVKKNMLDKESGFDFGDVKIDKNFNYSQEVELTISKAREFAAIEAVSNSVVKNAIAQALEEFKGMEK